MCEVDTHEQDEIFHILWGSPEISINKMSYLDAVNIIILNSAEI